MNAYPTPNFDGSIPDERDSLVRAAAERNGLDREEQHFILRGLNLAVFEHPTNRRALEIGIAAGVTVAVGVRDEAFQARKDAVDVAVQAAARPHVIMRSPLDPLAS